jgi:hypothetical protein
MEIKTGGSQSVIGRQGKAMSGSSSVQSSHSMKKPPQRLPSLGRHSAGKNLLPIEHQER